MKVVAAVDKFRGTAAAVEVAGAVASAAERAGWICDQIPMADGGEGFLDALGGPNRVSTVSGPLGDPVEAGWRITRRTAVVEMARASGLVLVGGAGRNDAVAATTYGTGELIQAAIDAGATRILVGMGGSATTDGGLGALRALEPVTRLRSVELVVACDVSTLFVDAPEHFAPQKGASATEVQLLRGRLERLAQIYEEEYGLDVRSLPGSGAAGGLAGGLAAVGAELVSGFGLVAEMLHLEERFRGADLVITGEGVLDEESFRGKVVGGVTELAEAAGVPVVAVVGDCHGEPEQVGVSETGGLRVVTLVERFGGWRALHETLRCVEEATAEILVGWGRSPAPPEPG